MSRRRITIQNGLLLSGLGAFGLFLMFLVFTGETWRAIAYALVALFAFLVGLAFYFWGTVFFGGFWGIVSRRRTPVPWSIGDVIDVPEHDLDPGLELLAAGMLVYRMGEVKPHIHFRKVPLADVRALRPFVVVRTGMPRTHQFEFALTDERDIVRSDDVFAFDVRNTPQLVMPDCLLRMEMPRRVVGQRWTLRVRAGVTVITSLRFMFVDGARRDEILLSPNGGETQRDLLPALLDEAIKRDVMIEPGERVLEV